jgi:hypothetical protein
VFFGSLWPRRSGEQLLRCKSHQHSESVECRGVRRGVGSGPRGAGEWSIRTLQASRNVMTAGKSLAPRNVNKSGFPDLSLIYKSGFPDLFLIYKSAFPDLFPVARQSLQMFVTRL